MYIIIKTTVTISMIQKNTVHNVILYTTNKFKEKKKRNSCRQDHICLMVIQSSEAYAVRVSYRPKLLQCLGDAEESKLCLSRTTVSGLRRANDF